MAQAYVLTLSLTEGGSSCTAIESYSAWVANKSKKTNPSCAFLTQGQICPLSRVWGPSIWQKTAPGNEIDSPILQTQYVQSL